MHSPCRGEVRISLLLTRMRLPAARNSPKAVVKEANKTSSGNKARKKIMDKSKAQTNIDAMKGMRK
jgi:hypothetical protein